MNEETIHNHIHRIELYTRRLLSGALVGSSRSAQKGIGLDFDQLRDYTIGDDPRIIDWLGSARSQRLLVKQYQEERNRTIYIVVDGSLSMQFGLENKFERAAWIAGVIAMIGGYGADRVGLLVYTDTVELQVPHRANMVHVRSLIHDLYTYKPKVSKTDARAALKVVGSLKERALVFVLSDCIDDALVHALRALRKHDILVVCCTDEREQNMPSTGVCMIQDAESGCAYPIYLNNRASMIINNEFAVRSKVQQSALKAAGVTVLTSMDRDKFMRDLVVLMRRRMRY